MRTDSYKSDVVWQVVCLSGTLREQIEQYLEGGGHRVIRYGVLPPKVQTGTVRTAIVISDAERRVLEAMCAYDRTEEIAADLHVSEATVRTHISALMRKFDVHSRRRIIVQALISDVLALVPSGGSSGGDPRP